MHNLTKIPACFMFLFLPLHFFNAFLFFIFLQVAWKGFKDCSSAILDVVLFGQDNTYSFSILVRHILTNDLSGLLKSM